jgi:hypothetical protein
MGKKERVKSSMEASLSSHFGHRVDEIPNMLKWEFRTARGTSFDEWFVEHMMDLSSREDSFISSWVVHMYIYEFIVLNCKLVKAWMKAIVTCFKVPSIDFPKKTEEYRQGVFEYSHIAGRNLSITKLCSHSYNTSGRYFHIQDTFAFVGDRSRNVVRDVRAAPRFRWQTWKFISKKTPQKLIVQRI